MTGLTLAEELILLAYNDEGRNELGSPNLGYGLSGALLMELALAGRLMVADGRVTVADPTPPGDPLLDAALERIRAEVKPRKPKWWIEKLAKGLSDRVLDGLVNGGVLRREEGRVLGVFPRTRYPSTYGVEPPAETDARRRLRTAVAQTGPAEPRTAALCALVRAVGLDRKVFPDLPRKQVKARLKEISEGAWGAEAARKAIAELEAAMAATVATAAIASTTATS